MVPATAEEQFKFLICCIRYCKKGKIDFEEVANECGVVSKRAAAKRYERMMKANGIHQTQTQSTGRETLVPSVPHGKVPLGGNTNRAAKKRKDDSTSTYQSDAHVDDDEDSTPPVKTESNKRFKLDNSSNIENDATSCAIKTEVPSPVVKKESHENDSKTATDPPMSRIKAEPVDNEAPMAPPVPLAMGGNVDGDDNHDDWCCLQ